MKIETQPLENHQVRLTAEIDAAVFEDFKKRAARQIALKTKFPGFRPGKATYDIVKRNIGEDAIQKQAIEICVDEIFPKILEEAGIKASGPASLDEISSSNPPKFSFTIPLIPEVILGDYRSIRKEYHPVQLLEEDVEKVLRNMQKNSGTSEPVDRPAQFGDLIYLKVSGQLSEPSEGQDAELINNRSIQIVIGDDENNENAWPFQGFSKEIMGLSAQEGKTLIYNYPENSPFENLKMKEVQFQIVIQGIKELVLPELNDDFAKSLGEYQSFAELRSVVCDLIIKEHQDTYDKKFLFEIIEEIVDQSIIKYPPKVLEEEIKESIQSLIKELEEQKMELRSYLKARKMEEADFIENEIKPDAKSRLERTLVLSEIAKQENIVVGKEELLAEVTKNMSQIVSTPGYQQPKGSRKISDLVNAVSYNSANHLMNQLIMDLLKTIATGEFVPGSETSNKSSPEIIPEKKPRKTAKKKRVPANGADLPSN